MKRSPTVNAAWWRWIFYWKGVAENNPAAWMKWPFLIKASNIDLGESGPYKWRREFWYIGFQIFFVNETTAAVRCRSLNTIPFLLVFDKGWPTSDFKWFPSLRVVLNNLFFDKILLQTKRFRPASRRERGEGFCFIHGWREGFMIDNDFNIALKERLYRYFGFPIKV